MTKHTSVQPFIFHTRLHLSELTGRKAATLNQFLRHIREVPESCIYYHTHRFLQLHQYLCPEPPNDFAYWVNNIVKETELAEKLASVDTVQFSSLNSLRDKIVSVIAEYLGRNPRVKFKFVCEGQEFHFIKSISFILPTELQAQNLREFVQALGGITVGSLYFHMFESRIRFEKGDNDFSFWLRTTLREVELADRISRLDPYTHTMEALREKLANLINQRLNQK